MSDNCTGGRDPADDRDRDGQGRARNARARDRLGRPLPRGHAGVAAWPENQTLTPDETLEAAQDLLDRGWPFQAHEVLEAAWKAAPDPQRPLWQGLAQLAVGVTHAARGNPRGAAALLQRGRDAITPYHATAPHRIDVSGLLNWASASLKHLAATGDQPVVLDGMRLPRARTQAARQHTENPPPAISDRAHPVPTSHDATRDPRLHDTKQLHQPSANRDDAAHLA